MERSRNLSIDILKFFAVLLITNSHMENYFYQAYKNRNIQPLLYFIIAMLGLFVSVWPALSLLWKTENVFDMMFIWDAGGRNYLPIR